MPHIRLQDLGKDFTDGRAAVVPALSRLTLEVGQGEFLTLVGPSGSGKTTLLRLIAGLEVPTTGRVLFDGQDVTAVPPERRGTGVVFQRGALFPHLNVFENLALGLRLRREPTREVERRVRAAADLLGITPVLGRRPHELAGGERQRVSLGRVLVAGASVMLLDEPLASLDAPLRAQLRREILQIHRQQALTVVYVTHDQGEALGGGGRVAVLRSGVLQQVGIPGELLRAPANRFVAEFLGTPPMNLLVGRVTGSGDEARFESSDAAGARLVMSLPEPMSGEDGWKPMPSVVLGIRPRDLHVRSAEAACRRGTAELRGVVEFLEDTGGAAWLHVRWGSRELLAAMEGGGVVEPGREVCLDFDGTRAHWFDGRSGAVLRAPKVP